MGMVVVTALAARAAAGLPVASITETPPAPVQRPVQSIDHTELQHIDTLFRHSPLRHSRRRRAPGEMQRQAVLKVWLRQPIGV
jgi:hypothetical protein